MNVWSKVGRTSTKKHHENFEKCRRWGRLQLRFSVQQWNFICLIPTTWLNGWTITSAPYFNIPLCLQPVIKWKWPGKLPQKILQAATLMRALLTNLKWAVLESAPSDFHLLLHGAHRARYSVTDYTNNTIFLRLSSAPPLNYPSASQRPPVRTKINGRFKPIPPIQLRNLEYAGYTIDCFCRVHDKTDFQDWSINQQRSWEGGGVGGGRTYPNWW